MAAVVRSQKQLLDTGQAALNAVDLVLAVSDNLSIVITDCGLMLSVTYYCFVTVTRSLSSFGRSVDVRQAVMSCQICFLSHKHESSLTDVGGLALPTRRTSIAPDLPCSALVALREQHQVVSAHVHLSLLSLGSCCHVPQPRQPRDVGISSLFPWPGGFFVTRRPRIRALDSTKISSCGRCVTTSPTVPKGGWRRSARAPAMTTIQCVRPSTQCEYRESWGLAIAVAAFRCTGQQFTS